ncbi:MAG: hypothetical protein ACXWVD_04715 [Telluria sp.]
MNTLARHLSTLADVARLPVATLHFHSRIDPQRIPEAYRYHTKPHPRYRIIGNKTLGAALIDLKQAGTRETYMGTIGGRNQGAALARKARARGYTLAEIDRNKFVDQIHAINTSVENRQGRPMDPHYLQKVEHFESEKHFRYFGILDPEGALAAYANLGFYGDFCAFSHLLGRRNNHGVMHLLVVDIVSRVLDEGQLRFIMYDTYFGASPGMRHFKSIVGFTPYRVRYRLE